MEKNKKTARFLPLWIVLGFVLLLGVTVYWYLSDYYHAEPSALSVIEQPAEGITVEKTADRIAFIPESYDTGMIFYPGAKVEFSAYAPIMERLSENGVLCVIVHMPGNMAVMDSNAADRVMNSFPKVSTWYIGGHSLGGAMAAGYALSHSDQLKGLVLLGAYSTNDLHDTDLRVLSVYGSEDQVLNHENYRKYRQNLPDNAVEQIIEGGCHAYFGNYGEQAGDGVPAIAREKQQEITVNLMIQMINGDNQ